MKSYVLIGVALGLLCLVQSNFAQENAAPENNRTQSQSDKENSPWEVGAHYASLDNSFNTSHGFGGRLTYNINRNLAIESELNFFPRRNFNGNAAQALFGVKAGKRWDKFGLFAKARPGFIYNSRGRIEAPTSPGDPFRLNFKGDTNFNADVGGVVEFYPTKKITARFDFGDTITRTNAQNAFYFDQNGNLQSFRIPPTTRHSFQFSAGIGFRF